jgi:hypothetical protein
MANAQAQQQTSWNKRNTAEQVRIKPKALSWGRWYAGSVGSGLAGSAWRALPVGACTEYAW